MSCGDNRMGSRMPDLLTQIKVVTAAAVIVSIFLFVDLLQPSALLSTMSGGNIAPQAEAGWRLSVDWTMQFAR